MAFDREFYKTMIKAGGNVHAAGHFFNVPGECEWLKWLSYFSFHEKAIMKDINNKKVKDLTEMEKMKLYKYDEYMHIANIIKHNMEQEHYDESFLEVLDYIDNHDFKKLITSKLSVLERENLDKIVNQYIDGDHEVFKISDDISLDEYMKLSIYDAYVLYRINVYNSMESNRKMSEQLEYMHERNIAMQYKSWVNARNSKPCL